MFSLFRDYQSFWGRKACTDITFWLVNSLTLGKCLETLTWTGVWVQINISCVGLIVVRSCLGTNKHQLCWANSCQKLSGHKHTSGYMWSEVTIFNQSATKILSITKNLFFWLNIFFMIIISSRLILLISRYTMFNNFILLMFSKVGINNPLWYYFLLAGYCIFF